MPVDYWNQFINIDDENVRSPPYNPATHNKDGTPLTPECRPGKTRQSCLKGKYHGVFDHFVKNGEIRPSLGYKIILEQREERNQLNS